MVDGIQDQPGQAPGTAPGADQAQAPDAGGESAQEIVSGISTRLDQLGQLLQQSGQGTPEDSQALQALTDGFRNFVTQNLGSQPGQGQAPAPAEAGRVPAQVGAATPQQVL
jgi:hypothetical protein